MSTTANQIAPIKPFEVLHLKDQEYAMKVEKIKMIKDIMGHSQKNTDTLRDCIRLGESSAIEMFKTQFGEEAYEAFNMAFEAAVEAGTISGE